MSRRQPARKAKSANLKTDPDTPESTPKKIQKQHKKSSGTNNKNTRKSAPPPRCSRGTKPLELSPADQCKANGPNGPPVFDARGYELDYEKCKKIIPTQPRKPSKKYEKILDQRLKEGERKAEIVGVDHSRLNELGTDWLVARKLGKPYHKIGLENYEEFEEQGLTLELEDGKVKISKRRVQGGIG